VLASLILAAGLLWVYAPTLAELIERWAKDSRYSHGYFVPLFAGYLLWSRRAMAPAAPLQPSLWGLGFIVAGLAMRLYGSNLAFFWLNQIALLPLLAGAFLLIGGWTALRWSWPAIAFLLFMLPMPYRVEVALAQPLQRIGTLVSVYALQTLGFAPFAEGNVIVIKEHHIGVVAACSGLSMLLIFFALSTAVALVSKRPLLDRLIIIPSAIPIAVICNVIRITVTGMLHVLVGPRIANLVFHDLAGWLMMPMALGFLWLELKLLAWVFPLRDVDDETRTQQDRGLLGLPAGLPPRPKPVVAGALTRDVTKENAEAICSTPIPRREDPIPRREDIRKR
jgi:exosortase